MLSGQMDICRLSVLLCPVQRSSLLLASEPDWRSGIFKMLMVHQNPSKSCICVCRNGFSVTSHGKIFRKLMETPHQALSKLGMLTPQQDAEETGVLWVIPGAWVAWVAWVQVLLGPAGPCFH